MQSLGRNTNSSAVVTTPHFDQTYNCFTFYFHMFGVGMGQLRLDADVNGLRNSIWSRTGINVAMFVLSLFVLDNWIYNGAFVFYNIFFL